MAWHGMAQQTTPTVNFNSVPFRLCDEINTVKTTITLKHVQINSVSIYVFYFTFVLFPLPLCTTEG